jgi:hypothetical protein
MTRKEDSVELTEIGRLGIAVLGAWEGSLEAAGLAG